ncbi:MAG: beta-ketoacyl-[acyl-carrier-protein] synthase family protein [Solirubrobacterales bacterium]|nr:beta-ketoacyl-[acyl-carrier-protein] synthase family protein [Solirubrobacterales bacterium]
MGRVVITGLGAVTPLGNDVASSWEAMKAGRSGIGLITTFDTTSYPVKIGGMCDQFEVDGRLPDSHINRYLHRGERFGVAASAEALADAGLEPGVYEPDELGVSMGASVDRPTLQELSDVLSARRHSDGHRLERFPPSRALQISQTTGCARVAQLAGASGPMISVSTACTASLHAIGEAYRRIQDGDVKAMVAGGYDALTSWLDVLGFALLGALTTEYNDDPEHASRPFDRDRSGFVIGEGATVFVLEDLESAEARGAEPVAEVLGYAASLNAYRMTDPPPDGGGAVLAMRGALREAHIDPTEVDYVVAHGTGTPSGDVSETIGIKRAFDGHAHELVVTSPKSMVGHTTCAAGALNVLAGVLAMRDGIVSPTINLDTPDPECDLDYVPNQAREMPVRTVVTNGFAFGGTNGALCLRRFDG